MPFLSEGKLRGFFEQKLFRNKAGTVPGFAVLALSVPSVSETDSDTGIVFVSLLLCAFSLTAYQ